MIDSYLTPSAISYLTQSILSLTITGYFVYRIRAIPQRNRQPHLLLIMGFFATIAAFSLLLFAEASLPRGHDFYAIYPQTAVLGIGLVLLLQFAYHFPALSPRQKWESYLVLGLSAAYALWEGGFALHRFHLLHQGEVIFRPEWADFPLALAFLWAPVVFARQTRRISVETTGAKGPALHYLWRPQGRGAHTARALALVYLLPFVLSLTNLLTTFYIISRTTYHISLSLGILVALASFAVVYLDYRPEATSFVVKLVGVTLLTLLAVLGAVGWAIAPRYAASYRPTLPDHRTLRFSPNARGGYDVTAQPFAFETDMGDNLKLSKDGARWGALLDFTFPFYGQTYHTLHVSSDGTISLGQSMRYTYMHYHQGGDAPMILPLFIDLDPEAASGGVFARQEGERLILTWNRLPSFYVPQALFTFQVILYRSGIFDITYDELSDALTYTPNQEASQTPWLIGALPGGLATWPELADFSALPLQGDARGIVQDYQREFRGYLHQFFTPLAYLIVGASLLVMVGFPILIYVNLVRPLKTLLVGVKQMNAGRYDVNIAVQYPDEIGFLTQSFNVMAAELHALIHSLEKRVAERTQALQESEARMRQITGAMRQAVWLRNAETSELLYVNPAYEDIWGRTCESLMADPHSWFQAIHPEDQERIGETLRTEPRDAFFNQEYRIHQPNGVLRWIWDRNFPIKNEAGAVYRTLTVVEDITERKQMADILQRAKEAAETANRAKSTFLASMSHELRTPLNAILGFSELMAHDANLTASQRQNLEIIARSGDHLLALINDVLALSKIEAGRAELQPETLNLHRMLEELGGIFSLQTQQKGLTLAFDITPDVPQYIYADQRKLKQVLINLLSNAVKFTAKGGITMGVEKRETLTGRGTPPEDMSPAAPPASATVGLHFEIKDTGIGIAANEMEKVFEAFVQTSSGQRSQQGTGLGLPISREYVRLMGGDLTVQSEVGVGSVFSFDIQAEAVAAMPADAYPTYQIIGLEPGQPTYRILIAEDDEASRVLLMKFLAPLGFEVEEACNGAEAVARWETWRPHLIFMDMRMPVMNGRQATQMIKSKIQQPKPAIQTIIIALTASAFEEERDSFLAAGCDDFVRKPFREATIVEILTRHLGVRFTYATPNGKAASRLAPLQAPVDPAQLAMQVNALDSQWIADMQRATVEGDMKWMETLVAQIRDQAPALAGQLAQLLYNFEHDEILRLLQYKPA